MKKRNVIIRLALIITIIIVVNLISNNLYFRLDFTAEKAYTLSKATEDVVKNLDDVVTVTAYFSEDLPPQLIKNRRDFEDLLNEYDSRSGGNIVYEFINPNESEEEENKTQQAGIQPLMVNVTERDQVKQLRAYMGAMVQMGDKKEIIPVIQPGGGIEYSLTTAIRKISAENKPKVAFLQGHGEPPSSSSMQVLEQLSVLYTVEDYSINDTSEIPSDFKTIAIIAPTDTFPPSHLKKLDNFMAGGGNLFVAYNQLNADLQQGYLSVNPDKGFGAWLESKGVKLENKYLVDVNCGQVTVRQQQGPFVMNVPIEFPFFPIVTKFAEHPLTKGLEQLFLPFTAPISIVNTDTAIKVVPVAFSSDKTGLMDAPMMLDVNKQWSEADFPLPSQTVAVTLSGKLGGSGNASMVMISNGKFAVNGEGEQQQQVNPDNVNMEVNAIDWLSDDTGLIDLRTKAITSRPLEDVEDGTKALLKYLNVFVPIILILLFAVFRRQQYIRRRNKWMQGVY